MVTFTEEILDGKLHFLSREMQQERRQSDDNFGMIHLLRIQNVLNNYYFLPSETHMHMCILGGKKC